MGEEYLVNSMKALKEIISEEYVGPYFERFEQFSEICNYKKINYCMDEYINAELDIRTAGTRGIGRMSDDIPRFGGYFRKQITKISEEEVIELAHNIKQILYIGYLSHVLSLEETLKTPTTSSEDALFKKWIPGIYASNIGDIPDPLSNWIFGGSEENLNKLKKIMKSNGLIGGGFMQADKTDMILTYYPVAGFGLRARE
ncbi:hypothetical protein [Sporosarcina sp. BP05]|uniref:hypothetical protein n=1 Tax=Sporosarcina sp. BP05 TaxID=2758726 RepID=UPI001647B778|nr:hypothetical protein [Sporosarcina sp. BP05]